MLPKLALVGTYSFTNPNVFNGFKNEFDGMFSVGVMLNIPILHWGKNYNKIYLGHKEDAASVMDANAIAGTETETGYTFVFEIDAKAEVKRLLKLLRLIELIKWL